MTQPGQVFLSFAQQVSNFLVFLCTTPAGWAVISSIFILFWIFRISIEVHNRRRIAAAAGEQVRPSEVIVTIFHSFISIGGKLVLSLPVLALLAGLVLTFGAIGDTLSKVQESIIAAERIKELQGVVRNLDRSLKVAEVRILSVQNDTVRMEISFYDPANPAIPAEKKEITIPGRDIYFDAIVLNFDYSEIAAGKRVNIAIPYRVFSDVVPQNEGIPLGGFDENGVPYMFHRADDDIYGVTPAIYRSRLVELMELIKNDENARPAGIIRSLYGSAVHKRVKPGDRLEIRVEQTGGITIKERMPF